MGIGLMEQKRRHQGHASFDQAPGRTVECSRIESTPRATDHAPARVVVVVRLYEGGGIVDRRLDHPGEPLDRCNSRPSGGHGVHPAQVRSNRGFERGGLVEHRREQSTVNLGADGQLARRYQHRVRNRPPCIGWRTDYSRVRPARGCAVRGSAGYVHARPVHRAGIHVGAQKDHAVLDATQVSDTRDPVAEIGWELCATDVYVSVDQPRDHPSAGKVNHLSSPWHRHIVRGTETLDPISPDNDGGISQGYCSRAVEHGGAHIGGPSLSRTTARGHCEQEDPARDSEGELGNRSRPERFPSDDPQQGAQRFFFLAAFFAFFLEVRAGFLRAAFLAGLFFFADFLTAFFLAGFFFFATFFFAVFFAAFFLTAFFFTVFFFLAGAAADLAGAAG